jgi:hypothetical protein
LLIKKRLKETLSKPIAIWFYILDISMSLKTPILSRPLFQTALLTGILFAGQENQNTAKTNEGEDQFINVAFQEKTIDRDKILSKLKSQNKSINKELVEFIKSFNVSAFEKESDNISAENVRLAENLKLLAKHPRISQAVTSENFKKINHILQEIDKYKNSFFNDLPDSKNIKQNEFNEISEASYAVIENIEQRNSKEKIIQDLELKPLISLKKQIKQEALEQINKKNPQGNYNQTFLEEHLGKDFYAFIGYNGQKLQECINFELSKEPFSHKDNLTVIIQGNELDNAFSGDNYRWLKSDKPVLQRYIDKDEDILKVFEELNNDSRHLKNKVRNIILSFHGDNKGITTKATHNPDEQYYLNNKDESIFKQLANNLANLLHNDGATIIINSCGSDYRDNPLAEILIEKVIYPAMTQNTEIKSVRVIGSKTSFTSRDMDTKINKENILEDINIKTSNNTIDILVERNSGGLSHSERKITTEKITKDITKLDEILNKTNLYNELHLESLEKMDTKNETIKQNFFFHYNTQLKSLITELFHTLKEINTSNTIPADIDSKKKLLENIDKIYNGFKKNLNSKAIQSLSMDYGYSDFKEQRDELINKMFSEKDFDADLVFNIIKLDPQKINEEKFKSIATEEKFLKRLIDFWQNNAGIITVNDLELCLKSLPEDLIKSTEVKNLATEIYKKLKEKQQFYLEIKKTGDIANPDLDKQNQYLKFAKLNQESIDKELEIAEQILRKFKIEIPQDLK